MSDDDVQHDYVNYENAKDIEGGLHEGDRDPAAGIGRLVVLGIGGIILVVVAVGWLLR
jgi:hypothetical protein